MKIDKKTKEKLFEALDEWLAQKLMTKRARKQILGIMTNKVAAEKGLKPKTLEETVAEQFVIISTDPTKDVWKDWTANETLQHLYMAHPQYRGQLSVIKFGRALTGLGTYKTFKNGTAVYAVLGIKGASTEEVVVEQESSDKIKMMADAKKKLKKMKKQDKKQRKKEKQEKKRKARQEQLELERIEERKKNKS